MYKKNILILNTNLSLGGVETQIGYIADRITKSGFIVHIVYFGKKNKKTKFTPFVKVKYLKWVYGFSRKKIKYLFYPLFFIKLLVYVILVNPDLIHTFGPIENITASLLKIITGKPIIVSVRTNAEDAFRFVSFWGKVSNAVLVNALSIGCQLVDIYNIPKEKIHLIRNGIDFNRFPCNCRKMRSCANHFKFALIGRINTSKNQLLALEAFNRLLQDNGNDQKMRLIMVGRIEDHGYYKRILRFIKEYNLINNVEIRPWLDNIVSFYQEIDCLILPSQSEGLPNVLLEAMASRVAWIAFNVADVKYLAGEDNSRGIITNKNNVNALAYEMKRILHLQNSERRKMCESARKFIEMNHSLDKLGKEIVRLYNSILYT